MVKVEFLGPIGKAPIEADISNLSELSSLLAGDEAVRVWLDRCAVAINDEIVSDANRALKDGDRVALLPPVCGG
ncbi:MAG: MoaD/ThiS family protein [Helicobacteraceae bacterium]|jgi:molybdopterin synthase sulfur carrier subunit|nr:MoaD/ThiS family protein [Helicobacteraceae bacterium]